MTTLVGPGPFELRANNSLSLRILVVESTSPAASIWTITERRRWRSIPT